MSRGVEVPEHLQGHPQGGVKTRPGREGKERSDGCLLQGEEWGLGEEVIEAHRLIEENRGGLILDLPEEVIGLLRQMMKILRKLAMQFREIRKISDMELSRKRKRMRRRKRRTLQLKLAREEDMMMEVSRRTLEGNMMMGVLRIDMTAGGIAGMRRTG